jgi:hypothetical protein
VTYQTTKVCQKGNFCRNIPIILLSLKKRKKKQLFFEKEKRKKKKKKKNAKSIHVVSLNYKSRNAE